MLPGNRRQGKSKVVRKNLTMEKRIGRERRDEEEEERQGEGGREEGSEGREVGKGVREGR